MHTPPIARRETAADPYRWLESRDDPEVLAYLQAENAYLEHCLSDCREQCERLFDEIRRRIRETDLSLPVPRGGNLYYQRTRSGDEYPRYYRCPAPADGSLEIDEAHETLLLDLNALAAGGHLALGAYSISPDQRYLAYSLDFSGDERYRLFVRDLQHDRLAELPFTDSDGSMVWANDNRTLFFTGLDETQRPATLYRYRLDETTAEPILHEADERFFLHCYRSSSEHQLIVQLSSKTTSEVWTLDADQPGQALHCLASREEGHEYDADHGWLDGSWRWLIRSNQDGRNFALYQAPHDSPQRPYWQLLHSHDPNVMLEGIGLNRDAYVLSLRENGLPLLEIHPAQQSAYRVTLPDEVYSLDIHNTLEFDSPIIRLRYESLNRPAEIRQLHLASGRQQVLRRTPVEGGFQADAYLSRRLWATASDGTRIPISLVARRDLLDKRQPAPLYLYGYGAYGDSLDPWFSHARLSLLERGVIFAIAHVRGGGELGEAWHEAGRLAHKHNTFDDFICCARHLIDQGLTCPAQLAISGASAGGLLIGAVLNQAPQLFAAAIAEVPFVDVLNTMRRPELPLTITEYDEWGDPADPQMQHCIERYAPYENVRAQAYPALLVMAGYHDSRVQYWEAAKWVAKLRAHKTDDNPLLLKTDFDAGHGGASGRYQAIRDIALEYAFLFSIWGI